MTRLLERAREGDSDAVNDLVNAVYEELRTLAARIMDGERDSHTLQPTALVHEAYLRLVEDGARTWENRAHFFASAAGAIRRILVDHARRRNRVKRGGGRAREDLELDDLEQPVSDGQLLAVDEALEAFEQMDGDKARMVELRFFGGLTVDEVASVLKRSPSTVAREWRLARAWLRRRIESQT